MLRQLRCLAGHSWEAEDGDDVPHCPRCGELADDVALFSDTPLPPAPAVPADALDQPTRDGRGWPVIPGYELREKLPPGPLGVERYRARHVVGDRIVVVEVVVAASDPGQVAWGSLRGEARALGKLDHPNIAPLLGTGERERLLFYNVLPDEAGPTLAEWLDGQPLPWREAVDLARVLARAMAHAHGRGVVHRAVQPRFVRLCPADGDGPGCVRLRGQWYRPRLERFGLFRPKIREHEPTDLELQPEDPAYLSPEQALGRPSDIGPRTDVFALGVLLAELILGRSPLAAGSRMQTLDNAMRPFPLLLEPLRPHVPADLYALLTAATAFTAKERPANAGELAEDLDNVRHGRPLRGSPPRLVRRLLASAAVWAFLAGAALMAVILTIATSVRDESRGDELALRQMGPRPIAQAEFARLMRDRQPAEQAVVARAGRLLDAGEEGAARDLLDRLDTVGNGWEWGYLALRLAGGPVAVLNNDPNLRPTAVSFLAESGAHLAVGMAVRSPQQKEETGRLEVWSRQPPTRLTVDKFDWPPTALAAPPGGSGWIVLTSSAALKRSRLHVWNPTDGRQAREPLDGARTGLTLVPVAFFSGGGTGVASLTTDHASTIWTDCEKAERLRELPPYPGPTGLIVAPSAGVPTQGYGDYFVADNAGKVVLRIRTGLPDDTIPLRDLETATALAVTNDGRWLAGGGPSGRVRLWRVGQTVEPADRWQVGTRPVTSLAFTPDGSRLAVGTDDGRLVLFDTEHGQELVNARLGDGAVSALAFSPDGRALAAIHGQRVLLWH